MPDAYTQYADEADAGDTRSFDEVMTEIEARPVTTDVEQTLRNGLCEQLRFAFARLKPRSQSSITESLKLTLEELKK